MLPNGRWDRSRQSRRSFGPEKRGWSRPSAGTMRYVGSWLFDNPVLSLTKEGIVRHGRGRRGLASPCARSDVFRPEPKSRCRGRRAWRTGPFWLRLEKRIPYFRPNRGRVIRVVAVARPGRLARGLEPRPLAGAPTRSQSRSFARSSGARITARTEIASSGSQGSRYLAGLQGPGPEAQSRRQPEAKLVAWFGHRGPVLPPEPRSSYHGPAGLEDSRFRLHGAPRPARRPIRRRRPFPEQTRSRVVNHSFCKI
jgi:hypothetical protein